MRKVVYLVVMMLALASGGAAKAQRQAWIQIEARPNLSQAQDRARAYASAFANVEGFALSTGWYAIVLGPYGTAEARSKLTDMRRDGMIPSDSYVVFGERFRRQFWPIGDSTQLPADLQQDGGAQSAQPAPDAQPAAPSDQSAQSSTAPASPDTAAVPGTQSLADARQAEAQLDAQQRQHVQEALKWEGYYDGAIDGAFGPGTRGSMSAWQSANGFDPTGVLTTYQRETLEKHYETQQAALGLKTVTDEDAGISIDMPTALVGDPRYDPPFAHYDSRNGSGVRVLLISEPGDKAALDGLYNLLQTLQIIPMHGDRELGARSFTISGRSDKIASYSYAEMTNGLIKGYVLIWKTGDDKRMARVLAAMKASFRPFGANALDASMTPTPADQRRDLLNGLEVRKPAAARSGFFVDSAGMVLTTDSVLKHCARITIGADHPAKVVQEDRKLGIALLKPEHALAPRAVAKFEGPAPAVGDAAAVAGFSYGGVLNAPVMTYGTVEGLTGLQGERDQRRLALKALPGDAGGPVFDQGGTVIGMLLPRSDDQNGKQLPGNVRFVRDGSALSDALKAAGISPAVSSRSGDMAPEDLAALGANTAVLVRCWK